jgi:hypothetical protein
LKNLELDTSVISKILAKLLDQGLKAGTLDHNDFGLSDDETEFLRPCFLWLQDEGLVRWLNTAHSKNASCWIDPVLTARGFALLGTQLEFDGKQLSVAEIVSSGEKVSGNYNVFGDFLGGALGGFIKSMRT